MLKTILLIDDNLDDVFFMEQAIKKIKLGLQYLEENCHQGWIST